MTAQEGNMGKCHPEKTNVKHLILHVLLCSHPAVSKYKFIFYIIKLMASLSNQFLNIENVIFTTFFSLGVKLNSVQYCLSPTSCFIFFLHSRKNMKHQCIKLRFCHCYECKWFLHFSYFLK